MSLLAVGLSHRSAPLPVLERAALGAGAPDFRAEVLAGAHVTDAIVLATCNRIEVYAQAERFHGGVAQIAEALARAGGLDIETLADVLYVHYDSAAAEHLFTVAAGLDSMAVGESQILGQVRSAWQAAHAGAGAGPARQLDELFQQALRVGKRAQTETGLDRLSNSLVELALDEAARLLPAGPRHAVVVGAGAMAAVAVTAIGRRWTPGSLTIVNRNRAGAERLAGGAGAAAAAVAADWDTLPQLLHEADLVVCCTGAVGHVIEGRDVARARDGLDGQPLVLVDLALPRDVDPLADMVSGVHIVDLGRLGHGAAGDESPSDVPPEALAARTLVAEEVTVWRAERAATDVDPTVVALRGRAEAILDSELARLRRRLPDMSAQVSEEVERAVRRVVGKVLHTPTVRVKQLADAPGGSLYAEALRTLFDLDVSDVTTADQVLR